MGHLRCELWLGLFVPLIPKDANLRAFVCRYTFPPAWMTHHTVSNTDKPTPISRVNFMVGAEDSSGSIAQCKDSMVDDIEVRRCVWHEHVGQSSYDPPLQNDRIASLDDAKLKCREMGPLVCKAITCTDKPGIGGAAAEFFCVLRRASVLQVAISDAAYKTT